METRRKSLAADRCLSQDILTCYLMDGAMKLWQVEKSQDLRQAPTLPAGHGVPSVWLFAST
jgi:hypothetical protein